MKVLIADDDSITRLTLGKRIRDWGYEAIEAEDGMEAWESLKSGDPPRIAILDWMMPEIEGVEICERLQQARDLPFIYSILLTVRNEKEDIVKALDSGAHDFLSKPVHIGELCSHCDFPGSADLQVGGVHFACPDLEVGAPRKIVIL